MYKVRYKKDSDLSLKFIHRCSLMIKSNLFGMFNILSNWNKPDNFLSKLIQSNTCRFVDNNQINKFNNKLRPNNKRSF